MEFDIQKVGVNFTEDMLKNFLTNVLKPAAAYYIAKSETKIDDVILPFLSSIEEGLLGFADKIDGEVG